MIPLAEPLLILPGRLKWHFVKFCNRRYYPPLKVPLPPFCKSGSVGRSVGRSASITWGGGGEGEWVCLTYRVLKALPSMTGVLFKH